MIGSGEPGIPMKMLRNLTEKLGKSVCCSGGVFMVLPLAVLWAARALLLYFMFIYISDYHLLCKEDYTLEITL